LGFLGRVSAIRDPIILAGVELDEEKTTGKQRNIISWTRRSLDMRLSFPGFGSLVLSSIESVRSCIGTAELIETDDVVVHSCPIFA
jgi:hypothetical protein